MIRIPVPHPQRVPLAAPVSAVERRGVERALPVVHEPRPITFNSAA
jgi:hypothetical protein